MMEKIFCFILCAALCAGMLAAGVRCAALQANAAGATEDITLYVSPDGDDAAAGTIDAPLKTVAGAKEKLKTLKSSLKDGTTVRVRLRGGVYEFDQTLDFTADDVPDVTYAAYQNEEVSFSGAKEITGFTEETVNGVRVFTKTLAKDDPKGFKSLFRGGKQLTVPRWPETGYFTVNHLAQDYDIWTDETTPWDFTRGQRAFYADPADLTEFTAPTDVQVRILHYWHDELMYLTDVDYATGLLQLSRPSSMYIRTIDRYYFENVFEAMNEPGEWYLNNETGVLYYVPEADETAESCVLRASNLECLIDIDGVDGIRFEGIRFTETDWNVPSPGEWEGGWRAEYDIDALQAALDVKGVVTVQHAENVSFTNCEFVNLGADGVKLMNGVKHSRVENCLFRNIAATGVFVGGANCQPDEPDCTADITVINNLIDGYGKKFYCAIGVHITFCDGAEVAHNEIRDGYYTAISCGWVWGYSYHLTKNIRITDNLIYNIGQGWLSDMGGIYMLGIQPGTVLSGNVIHNVAANPGDGGYGGWGIYLDEGSSRMLVEKNLVFCCASQAYNIHYGEGNVIRNNIGALCAEGQVSTGSRNEPHATATYYDNIFLTDDGAPIYLYMQNTSHFYENGNLFWDLSRGDDLRFSVNNGSELLTLAQAEQKGFLHNPTATDPLFADAKNYDFTLAEDSPAFRLNFQTWDYTAAGTLPGTKVGFALDGGQTAYNDDVSVPERTGEKASAQLHVSLLPVAAVLGALLALVWVVVLLMRVPAKTALMTVGVIAGVAAAVLTYRWFVKWSPVPYAVSSAVLCAAAAILPPNGKTEGKTLLRYLIRAAVILAVFYGVVLLLNNVLRIGEANVMSVVLTATGVYAAVCTVMTLKTMKIK